MKIRFKGTNWIGYQNPRSGLKAVRNGEESDHWTAHYWMSPEGELFCELACEGNRVTEYLPRAVWEWLVKP